MKKPLSIRKLFLTGLIFAWPTTVFAQTEGTGAGETQTGLVALWAGLKESFPNVIAAIIVFIIAFIIAKTAQKWSIKTLKKTGGHESAMKFVSKTVYAVCIVLGFTIALEIVGVDIGFIVGAASFGLGFALKDMLENYVAGIIILIQEPFKVGDIVEVNEHFGRIEEIEARSTMIRVWDGQRVIVPNSVMISNALINYSTYPERRITVDVGVSYDTDLTHAVQIVTQALVSHDEILKDPPPHVTLSEYGESSINMKARFWIDATVSNWLTMTGEGVRLIKEAFDKEGINIPFPIRTLSLNRQDSDDMYEVFNKQNPANK